MSPSAGGQDSKDSIPVLCLQVTWTLGWSSLAVGHASDVSLFCPSVKWQAGLGGYFVNNHSMEHFNKTDFSTEMALNLLLASMFLMFCSLVNLLLALYCLWAQQGCREHPKG